MTAPAKPMTTPIDLVPGRLLAAAARAGETITVVIGVMPLMTPTMPLATVLLGVREQRERDGVVEDAEDEELRIEAASRVGSFLRVPKKNTQQIAAPMLTRPAETQSGLISRIRMALNRNEQPQTAPSRMIRAQ